MGRPANADSSATFENIRDAALRLLNREGMEAVSVRRVAKEAGVAMGTLRYYFPSRGALLEACLDSYHQRLVTLEEHMTAHLRNSDDPRAAVADTIRAAFATIKMQPELQRLRLLTSMRQGELPKQRRIHLRGPFLRNAGAVLSEHSDNPANDMRMVVDSVMRLVAWYAACSDDETRDVSGEDSVEAAREKLQEHVIKVALRLIFGC